MSENIEKALHAIRKNGKWYIIGGSGNSAGNASGSVVAVSSDKIGDLNLAEYPVGTLFVLYEEE